MLALIIFISSAPLFAQEGRSFGFKTRVTFSNPSYTLDTNSTAMTTYSKAGFMAGVFVDLFKAGFFELSNELYFSRKVCSADATYQGIFVNQFIITSATARIDYLIYGVTGKAVFSIGKSSVYAMAEPRINFYTGSEVTVTDNTFYNEDYVKDRIKKIGYGINIGAGFNIGLTKSSKIFIEGLFCPDFFYAYEDGLGKARSNSFELRAGIGFF